MDRGLQRRSDTVFELRGRGLSHRNHPARVCRSARRQEARLGWSEHARDQRARSFSFRQTRLSTRVRVGLIPCGLESSFQKSGFGNEPGFNFSKPKAKLET